MRVKGSGETAKDQRHRLVALKVRQTNGILVVYVVQLEIWRDVPGFRCQSVEPLLMGQFLPPCLNGVEDNITSFQGLFALR